MILIRAAGSQSSNTFEYRVEDARTAWAAGDHGIQDSAMSGKERAMTPSELVKRLRLDTFGLTPSTTVILRSAPLRNRRQRSSVQVLNSMSGRIATDDDKAEISHQPVDTPLSDAPTSYRASVESLISSTSSKEGAKKRSSHHRFLRAKSNPETLSTIKESAQDTFTPTIVTTEKAAAVKISLETYYNELTQVPNPRASRKHYLDSHLYYNPQLSPEQKNAFLYTFYHQESCYLRQCRALKSQS